MLSQEKINRRLPPAGTDTVLHSLSFAFMAGTSAEV